MPLFDLKLITFFSFFCSSYCKAEATIQELVEKTEDDMNNFTDQSTYCKPEVYSEYSQTKRLEITIEDIKHSDELVQFYTGFPDYATFNAVYSSLVQHGADRMKIDNEEITNSVSSRTLRLIDGHDATEIGIVVN